MLHKNYLMTLNKSKDSNFLYLLILKLIQNALGLDPRQFIYPMISYNPQNTRNKPTELELYITIVKD